ncbi:DUF126 domain-containing protein [Methanococcoides methylutens]|uniref:DUF126 domain-containing protein n=1 Tax=Methanococcoides methylutens TaxID=2226 RepID=UPI00064EE1B8|nr:DUF126 domain-containing protein [Methanococcoides methylutens]
MVAIKIKCRTIARGVAEGEVLLSSDALSFLGNVDPKSGIVVDPSHAIEGKCIKDKVLVFPHGKGSTVGSYVIYQLKKNNVAPAAMINLDSEPIVAVGAIISGIPLVDRLEEDPYEVLSDGDHVKVDSSNGYIEIPEK